MTGRRVDYDAIIVGAGPNGLTAAARLATAGCRVVVYEAASTIGGGCRTAALTETSIYDPCAAVHPFAASSPAYEALRLSDAGLEWLHPPLALAHPFAGGVAAGSARVMADGTAAVLHRDLDATCDALGRDGDRWRSLVGGLAGDWERQRHLVLGPVLQSALRHPVRMAGFGSVAALPAALVLRRFATPAARALFAGFAAHSGTPLTAPTTAGVALALAASSHAAGMPVARGGSQAIVDALARVILGAGGEIVCDTDVTSLRALPTRRATMLDVTPRQFAALAGLSQPRWTYGAAAWKLDMLLDGPMPWTAAACAQAGTVHLGGDAAAIVASERAMSRGGVPALPYMIVSQPSTADPTRAPAGQHVVWAYRHVPNGCTASDAVGGMERQFDRYAPGWRERVLHVTVTAPADFAAYNQNNIGGDVAGGAMTTWQTIARPRLALDPFRTRVDDVWLCSQSTPPGPGAHGMCGWHAAGSVLRAMR